MPPHILAVCFDFGDTLVDENSEVKDATLTSLRGELIPGTAELLQELRSRTYRLALVADGRPGTYTNVLQQHGLYEMFEAFAISELLGTLKPDRRMFTHALQALAIEPPDYPRTVMVGNRLERDVKGANELGMISVWMDWSPRYAKSPSDASEKPQFTIHQPLDLLNVLDALEAAAGPGHT
jgi:putative hydrolase of the HAD superfamily